VGPDAAAIRVAFRRLVRLLGTGRAHFGQVVYGHHHPQVQVAPGQGLKDLDVRAQEASRLPNRVDGGRQADAPGRLGEQSIQAGQRERQVGSPAGGNQGVDLVKNDRVDVAQSLPSRTGQDQIQGLGGGDQDVRRHLGETPALVGRRVSSAHPGPDLRLGHSFAPRHQAKTRQRRAQVPLHVGRQGLQR